MSADKFMLELFVNDAAAQCAVLKENISSNGVYDSVRCKDAAASLKSSARMLGFAEFADVCAEIESAFAACKNKPSSETNIAKAVAELANCASSNVDNIEGAVKVSVEKLVKLRPFASAQKEDNSVAQKTEPREITSEQNIVSSSAKKKITMNIDDSMKAMFLEETRAQLASLSQGLVDIDGDFHNSQKLEQLMRSSHSIKGAARVVGLSEIVELTHEMENCFVSAQNGKLELNSDSLDAFLQCVDFISNLANIEFAELDTAQCARCLADIKAVESGDRVNAEKQSGQQNAAVYASISPVSPVSPDFSPKSGQRRDFAVKVSAKNLSALMELAAESLVENRRIEYFRDNLLDLKTLQIRLARNVERVLCDLESVRGADSSIERLDSLRKTIDSSIADIRAQVVELGDYSRRSAQLSARLYSEVLNSRMRPLAEGVQIFPRMVRDLAKSAGKKIILEIDGRDVPVDRDVLEKLESPLTHILRNACDHGIEMPEVRQALGKQITGRISVKAWHSSGFLMLRISDDGAGMALEKIKSKILERNLATAEMLKNMTRREIMAFLFLPGFTTKDNVTEISGRGVGLDVVNTALQEIGGTIEVESEAGRGAVFTMKLPITRSVLKSLSVEIGGELYAFPLNRVYRTAIVSSKEIEYDNARAFCDIGGRRAEIIDGSEALGFEASRKLRSYYYLVVIAAENYCYAIEVDDMPQEVDLVVRPINPRLGRVQCVSATSISETGLPILILDIDDLVQSAQKCAVKTVDKRSNPLSSEVVKRILVVDDSATVREIQRKILTSAGYNTELADDGVDGWNCVRIAEYDLIITDIDMPRMNGFELLKRIRSRDKKTPVIIVSYKDRREDRELGQKLGANLYLTKNSFQDDSFLTAVRKIISNEPLK